MACAEHSVSATEGPASAPAGKPSAPAALPPGTIAVVICTRDRPSALLATLDSVWIQSRRPDELIIIDDGRLPERLVDQVEIQCRRLSIAWQYRQTALPGLTKGRNLAAEIAASDVLQYLDDDVTCDVNFLMEVERIMRDPLVAGVTATVKEPAFEGFSARLYQFGYRAAGWWRIGPRGMPQGRRPIVLDDPRVAVRARWLSGAAMALRREIVLKWQFNEELTDYALGEDREFGYRLTPYCWLVESKRAFVRHRREESSRTDPRRLGFMTSRNYLLILSRTCNLRLGDWVVIGWSLLFVAGMHVLWAIAGDRRNHVAQLGGMLDGLLAFATARGLPVTQPVARASRPWDRWRDVGATECCSTVTKSSAGDAIRTPPMRIAHQAVAGISGRVLFVTTDLEPGGAELMLASLVRHLPRFGVKPFIACLKNGGSLVRHCRDEGTPVVENLLRHKADVGVIARIRRLVSEHRIDMVVAAQSGGDRMFWATLAGRLSGLPVAVWSHWFPRPGERHFELANRTLYRLVDVFIALGERHRLSLIRNAFVPAGRVAVIPNGIDVERFSRVQARGEARHRLGVGDRDIAVALIANLRPEKRHDVFIRAAERVFAANPRTRFFVIGDGPHGDAVRKAAAESGLPQDVLHLMGRRDDVAELLPGMDICCLCSEIECFSVTLLEAAAAGVALIGPEVGCLGEFLTHLQTGWVIRPADVPSLTDAIVGLAADADLRRRMTEAARVRVVREFGMDRTAEAFASLFRAVPRRVGGSQWSVVPRKGVPQVRGARGYAAWPWP